MSIHNDSMINKWYQISTASCVISYLGLWQRVSFLFTDIFGIKNHGEMIDILVEMIEMIE